MVSDLNDLLASRKYDVVLKYFLTEAGMNYGNLPKGLLQFHSYADKARIALEEHFLEGIHYAASHDGVVKLHFTVSAEHQDLFQQAFQQLIPPIRKSLRLAL